MDVKSRDIMLGEINERTKTTVTELIQINKHLALINGRLQRHDDSIVAINTTVYGKKSDKGLCGEVSTIKKTIFSLIIALVPVGAFSALELTDIINLI